MYKEQDIFRIHTSKQLGDLDGATSVAMFPLRLETKIQNKEVTKYNDQAGVLFVLKPLFDVAMTVQSSDCDGKALLDQVSKLLDAVYALQSIYNEDKVLVLELMDIIQGQVHAGEETRNLFEQIKQELSRVAVVKAFTTNRASKLIKDIAYHYKKVMTPTHWGKHRVMGGDYSVIRRYTDATKHIRDAEKFVLTLYDRLKEIPSLDNQQYKTLKYRIDRLFGIYSNAGPLPTCTNSKYIESKRLRNKNLSGAEHSRRQAILDLDKELDDFRLIRTPQLKDKLYELLEARRIRYAKTESTYRYTKLVYLLLRCMLVDKFPTQKRHKIIWTTAGHTIFEYHQELEWTRKVVKAYNKWVKDHNSDLTISLERLNKYSGFIRKRQMTITKQVQDALCVRIYPDELAVTQLTKRLSRQEHEDGRTFLDEYYNIGGSSARAADRKQYAWDRLCMKYPPYRAAWIVRTIVTAGQQPLVYNDDVFSIPVSNLMPSRFTVQAVLKTGKDTQTTFTRYGKRLPEELKVGINFNEKDAADFDQVFSKDPEKGLRFKDELSWMTDYDEAEKIGMAVTIPLSGIRFSPRAGKRNSLKPKDFEFSAIYVTGFRHHAGISSDEGSRILEDMLLCHLYSEEGLDVINTSTPTNILDNSTDTTYNTSSDVLSQKFFSLVERALPESASSISAVRWDVSCEKASCNLTDAESLNGLFGVRKSGGGVFNEVDNYKSTEMHISRTANEHLLDVFASEGTEETNRLIKLIQRNKSLRQYFVNFVSPRGTYSAIRVGTQPYGILPVGDFRNLVIENETMQNVQKVLLYLSEKWNNIAEMNHVVDKQNAGDEFLQLMGKTPFSSTYQKQDAVSIPNFLHAEYFKGSDDESDVAMDICKALGEQFSKETVAEYLSGNEYLPVLESKFTVNVDDEEVVGPYVDNLIEKIKSVHDITIERKDAIRLIKEFIDLFSYRLDAWMLGLLYYDMDVRSKRTPCHIAIGSYGWVFGLRNKSEETQRKELSDFIVAPSINQAVTAAVLRGAYLNRRASNTDTEVVDINLSSARVRKAIRIIEGVRNGLPVGAVLGADGERLLHDAYKPDHYGIEMDEMIWPLRQKFPLIDKNNSLNAGDGNEKITPNVFNGAQVIQSLRAKVDDPDNNKNIYEYFTGADGKPIDEFNSWCNDAGLPDNKNKRAVLLKIIGEMYDSYDALMDVALSDSIYQLCHGNMDAAAAIMNAMETESMLPMPGVTEVPVDSARIENKVIVALDTFGGTFGSGSYLYDSDPRVGKWMEEVLCLESHPENVTASELVYLSQDKERFHAFVNGLCSRSGEWDFARVVENTEFVAASISETLSHARPLKFEDLMKDSAPVAIEQYYDHMDLMCRYDRMRKATSEMVGALEAFLNDPASGNPAYNATCTARLESLLWSAFRMGATECVDIMKEEGIIGSDSAEIPNLMRAAERAKELMLTRLQKSAQALDALGKVENGLLSESQKNCYVKAMKELSTANFVVIPVVILKNNHIIGEDGIQSCMIPLEQIHAQAREGFFSNVDSSSLDEWLGEMANLRPVMHDLYIQQMFASMTTFETNPLSLYPVQLPLRSRGNAAYEWLGTEVSDEDSVFDANVYMVAHPEYLPHEDGTDPGITGLVLDFWTEKIPLRDQTAGLAFNFDQPDAEPPQSILLAMPETRSSNVRWTERRLARSIKCALHLVKCRAVEPDHMNADRWASGTFPLIDINLSNNQ